MKRLLPWAIAWVATCVLLVYYAFEVLLNGAFVIPVRHGWNVPVPDGGTIAVRGVNERGFSAEDARFEATYHPASSASAAAHAIADEPVGEWNSEFWNPVAYRVGAAIVFLPDPAHPFVRTARGQWKRLDLTVAGGTYHSVRHVSPETRVIIVDRQEQQGLTGRVFLQLSMDGEQLTPMREQLTAAAGASSP